MPGSRSRVNPEAVAACKRAGHNTGGQCERQVPHHTRAGFSLGLSHGGLGERLVPLSDAEALFSSIQCLWQENRKCGDSPPVQGHFLPAFSALTFAVPHSHCEPHAQRRAAGRGGGGGEAFVS
jgi:hypothetical protein